MKRTSSCGMGSFDPCSPERTSNRIAGYLSFAAVTCLLVTSLVGCDSGNSSVGEKGENGDAKKGKTVVTEDDKTGSVRGIQLRDMSNDSGITFVHTNGGSGTQYIMEAMTGGIATFDFDNDGLLDIYFLNGAPLKGTEVKVPPQNSLYRNLGDWKFEDVSEQAGIGDQGFGLGVAAADFDNDGDVDLYLNNYGPNALYRNNGDGTFTDVTEHTSTDNGNRVGAGAIFFDMESDGDVDLYCANYVRFAYELHPVRTIGGFARAPSPLDFEPEPDTLFRNNGDGTFTDVTTESGVGAHAGNGMGSVACDYDNDGDIDVFVCNDVRGNFFFENDGKGHFEEVGSMVGVAYNFWGKANGSMGADCADYDNDGWLDFFMTSYQAEMPVLYRNLGHGQYEDVAMKAGVGVGCLPHVNWGTGFIDVDNDGYHDVFVGNGHLEELIHRIDDTTAYRVADALFLNNGNGTFTNVSETAGDGMDVVQSTRGIAMEDMDNDGRTDVVKLNAMDKPSVLRNETSNGAHWLQIRLIGLKSNREGVGARVIAKVGDLTLTDEVHAGRGYQSHFGTRLHFGLGESEVVDRIEIRWPNGIVDVLKNVPADQSMIFFEGSSPGEPSETDSNGEA